MRRSVLFRYACSFSPCVLALSVSSSLSAFAQDDVQPPTDVSPDLSSNQASPVAPRPEAPALPPAGKRSRAKSSTKTKKSQDEQEKKQNSVFFPDWTPSNFAFDFYPVLGFEYLSLPNEKTTVAQGELGAYVGLRGIPLQPGNPGMQIEPGFGYAVGQAVVKEDDQSAESGSFQRMWGSLRTPIYYRFFRQVFTGKYGQVWGGPLPLSKRFSIQSDSGVLILANVSGHYTLTVDRAWGESKSKPNAPQASLQVTTVDHWLHTRLSSSVLNFFVDVGPGYALSKSSLDLSGVPSVQGATSGLYLLGLTGLDLFTDKIGFDASAKYVFASRTDVEFNGAMGRSPLEDLGAHAALVGLPADSLHASAFFGIRRILGAFGLGWRYSLEILNLSEKNNTKQEKRETQGLGVSASMRF